jgi:hypothetical protein
MPTMKEQKCSDHEFLRPTVFSTGQNVICAPGNRSAENKPTWEHVCREKAHLGTCVRRKSAPGNINAWNKRTWECAQRTSAQGTKVRSYQARKNHVRREHARKEQVHSYTSA